MFKPYKKTLMITSILTLLPILIGLILWKDLPEQVPTHWGLDGNPDQYSSRATAVFALPIVLFLLQYVAIYVTALDKRNKNQNPKVMKLVLWIIPIVSLLVNALVYATVLGFEVSPIRIVTLILSIMFIILGNYLPKCIHNHTIGIKIKWTLENEENWYATHRFAGKVWTMGGCIQFITLFFPISIANIILIGTSLFMFALPVLYSYQYLKNHS